LPDFAPGHSPSLPSCSTLGTLGGVYPDYPLGGQEDFFPACSEAGLLMPKKTKPFTGPFQNGLVHSPGRINGNTAMSQ
jgi:hypothetical protein